jgi:hypothetical protein
MDPVFCSMQGMGLAQPEVMERLDGAPERVPHHTSASISMGVRWAQGFPQGEAAESPEVVVTQDVGSRCWT